MAKLRRGLRVFRQGAHSQATVQADVAISPVTGKVLPREFDVSANQIAQIESACRCHGAMGGMMRQTLPCGFSEHRRRGEGVRVAWALTLPRL